MKSFLILVLFAYINFSAFGQLDYRSKKVVDKLIGEYVNDAFTEISVKPDSIFVYGTGYIIELAYKRAKRKTICANDTSGQEYFVTFKKRPFSKIYQIKLVTDGDIRFFYLLRK